MLNSSQFLIVFQDGFVSCSASVTGATVTSLWLYNIVDLRKTVIGAIDYVYNGPSECWNENICEKSIPNFLFLYIAAVRIFFHCLVFLVKWAMSSVLF